MHKSYLLSLLVGLIGLHLSKAQSVDVDHTVAAIKQVARPLSTILPDEGFDDITFLKTVLDGKKVIGLGEVSHGTHEVFQYKDRLIRYMIQELGFRSIVFEADYYVLEYLDKYINSEVDSLRLVGGGFALTSEYKAMMRWLRAFNQTQGAEDKVHVFGMESRGPYNTTTAILERVTNLSPADKQMFENLLETPYSKAKKKDYKKVVDRIPFLRESLDKNEPSYDITDHYLAMLEQSLTHTLNRNFNYRDAYMAKNVEWVRERSKDHKVIVSAHNGHVSKAQSSRTQQLGSYLHKDLGDDYYVIATDLNSGTVALQRVTRSGIEPYEHYYPKVKSTTAFEYYFSLTELPYFILEFKPAAENPLLKAFLESKKNMRMLGGTVRPSTTRLSLMKSFDMLIYFEDTKALQ